MVKYGDHNVNDAVRTLIHDYRFDTVNLKQTPYIPSAFNALVILKPTRTFSDEDKLKIDQYVMRGGKIFWMIDNMYAEFDSLYKSQDLLHSTGDLTWKIYFFAMVFASMKIFCRTCSVINWDRSTQILNKHGWWIGLSSQY